MNSEPITIRDVHSLVVHHQVSAADATARYYAGRTDHELAAALKECSRTTAFWEEHNRPDQVKVQRVRLGAITAETERRELVASRSA
jgi:hypothetical protein